MIKIFLPLIEILIIVFNFFLSGWVFFVIFSIEYYYILLLSCLIFVALSYSYNLYINSNIFRYLVNVITIWFIISGVIFTVIFLVNLDEFSRKFAIFWLIFNPILLTIWRVIFRKITRKNPINILVINSNYNWTDFEKQKLHKQNIHIFNTNDCEITKIFELVKQHCITQIIINNTLDVKTLTHLNISNIEVLTFTHFMEKNLRKCYLDGEIQYFDEIKQFTNKQKFIKHIIDYFGSVVVIVLTLPIMIFSMLKIKKESPGKAIFKQQRVGISGREFTVYKFRSMFENAHFDPYTQQNDSRIFPYGDIMRKTRIDELPQLINILKGDMSLIGPRTEWNILVDNYEKELPYYNLRHIIKPGLSGWAQVNYPYGENLEDTKQKLMYDLYYIKNWSFALELEIIVKTLLVVAAKKGL